MALSSLDGKARASLTLEEAAHAVVVYALRDQALTEAQGGPFRLLLPPGGDACRNVKHVATVELRGEAAGDLCGHTPEQHARMRGA
ncbi:MAG: molybdopterin-dependent oxidoreductase [Planctomycetes bacterium]|nr:molybdopterin-dependent oxidoreductase [Planctomycetota bacterium]